MNTYATSSLAQHVVLRVSTTTIKLGGDHISVM